MSQTNDVAGRHGPRMAALAAAATGLMAMTSAQGASVTYFLDRSNELPDGTNYLQVDIADGAAGRIDFTVTPLAPLADYAGSNFGIQRFGFNADSDVTADDIVDLPDGWSVQENRRLSSFGDFEFDLSGTGNSRVFELAFGIEGVDGDQVTDYAVLSTGNATEGNSFFAAHVADFDVPGSDADSAFFGGGTEAVIPVPAAVWLFGSALGLLGATRRLRRN